MRILSLQVLGLKSWDRMWRRTNEGKEGTRAPPRSSTGGQTPARGCTAQGFPLRSPAAGTLR